MIVNPPYFSNWVDQWFPPLANKILPFIARYKWITPNIISLTSFILYTLGCLLLILNIPLNYLISLILLPLSYIADCLDGQLARFTNRFSPIGDYLDKTLDVMKIFIITFCLSVASYSKTDNVIYIYLGFIASFFFCYRYYIKHEIMFTSFSKDIDYLNKSKKRIQELYITINKMYEKLSHSFNGKIKLFWLTQRSIFYVDEGEFIFFTCVGIIVGHVEFSLWILAISQLFWGIYRLFQRGYQLIHSPQDFINPIKR